MANEDFTSQLIKSLNKDYKTKVAYNLSEDESPTQVKRWVSTGSKLLDYICANQPDGGFPEGRIVEIFGPMDLHGIQINQTSSKISWYMPFTVECITKGKFLSGIHFQICYDVECERNTSLVFQVITIATSFYSW